MSLELRKRIITSIFLLLLIILMFYYTYIMIISSIIIALITWIEFYSLISKIFKKEDIKNKIWRFFFKTISLFYLCFLFFSVVAVKVFNSELEIIIIYSLSIAIMSDIGGLVVGKTIKGKKLTKISPNKTISGSVGSFAFSLCLIPFFIKHFNQYDLAVMILLTLMISLTSQVGDLFVSFLKRKAKVKNTSDLLPGHGGLLDRIDGIIFVIPIGLLIFNI